MKDFAQALDLAAHPEGGRYRRLFESGDTVINRQGTVRQAMTHIYYALDIGEQSRFHRIGADEVWHLYRGVGIRLHLWHPDDEAAHCVELNTTEPRYCHVVPAGTWQAAEPLAGPVFLGCTVAPGFDWDDFELIDAQPEQATMLRNLAPHLARFIDKVPEHGS